MRKNIFDLMNDSEIDVENEYRRIHELFEEDIFYDDYQTYTMCEYIEDYFFINWKGRGRSLSVDDMLISLRIRHKRGTIKDVTNLLLYIEVILNLISISDIENLENTSTCYNVNLYFTLRDNIMNLLEDLNYEVKELEDNKLIIVDKDSVLSAVAETNKKIADKVVEYRRFVLKGKIEEKREILNLLANEIEGMKPQFKGTTYSNLMDDVQFMLNNLNIRHNNLSGQYKKEYIVNLPKEELEKLYDQTFDMILGVYVIDKYLKNKKDIDELKNNIK